MAASSPTFAHQIEHALNKAKDTLTRAIGNADEQRIRAALERIDHIASNVAAGKRTNDEPTNDEHVSEAKDRNTLLFEQYDEHADTNTVVVRLYEVGQCCESCATIGPSGFCCDCGGIFMTRINGGIPKRRVRLASDFHDFEGEDDAAPASSNKKRKKNATRETSKPGPPKTLEEFVSMLFWSSVGNWAQDVEGYSSSILENLQEHFDFFFAHTKDHAYWTEHLSDHLWETIQAQTGQLAKVVNGFFPKEMKQRELYWETTRRDGEPLILKLIKDFSGRPPKKKEKKKKKNQSYARLLRDKI